MTHDLSLTAAVLVVLALAGFSARRSILAIAALLPVRGSEPPSRLPTITLLMPAHNEEGGVSRTLDAFDRLDYPAEALFAVVVDDGSTDETGALLDRWANERPRALALHLAQRGGKSDALNAGIAAAPPSDLIAMCDADLRPRPDWLLRLAPSFSDEAVGAAAAYMAPRNAAGGLVARYAALETWTHQLVTSAGKDRLDLNPPLLGASVYRRAALEELGGFRPGGPGEDVHATAALTRQGWRTRFVERAVVDNTLVERWRDYWHQHIRWGRNLLTAEAAPRPNGRPDSRRRALHPARRVEALIVRAGYGDRLVFAAGVLLALAGSLSPWVPAGYAAVVVAEATVAVVRAGEVRRLHRHLAAAATLFPLDMAASLTAFVVQLARRPRTWQAARRPERAPESV